MEREGDESSLYELKLGTPQAQKKIAANNYQNLHRTINFLYCVRCQNAPDLNEVV